MICFSTINFVWQSLCLWFSIQQVSEFFLMLLDILNKKKRPDALSLIRHIFGIKGCCAKFMRCDCHGSTTTNSNFLWVKYLTKLVKCCWYQDSNQNIVNSNQTYNYIILFLSKHQHSHIDNLGVGSARLVSPRRCEADNQSLNPTGRVMRRIGRDLISIPMLCSSGWWEVN